MSIEPLNPTSVQGTVVDDQAAHELAERIKINHSAVLKRGEELVFAAIAVGEDLLQAREVVPRGEWTAWLRDHVQLSVSTVYRYEKLAAGKNTLLMRMRLDEPLSTLSACLRVLNPPPNVAPKVIEQGLDTRKANALQRIEIDDEMIGRTGQWFVTKFPNTFKRLSPHKAKIISEEWAASILLRIFMKEPR